LTNIENTLGRRDRILKNMYEDGKISESAMYLAKAEEIELKRPETEKNNYVETYTYYCAIRLLMEQDGFTFRTEFNSKEDKEAYQKNYSNMYEQCQKRLYTAGYRIYTSMDLEAQTQLQQAIDDKLKDFTEVNEEGVYKLQGAGVCIDNETGYVCAIVGGRSQDFDGYTLNRAYQSYRQPGSAIKPLIVYTPILERGYTPDSIVVDQAIEDGPSNADGVYSGEMTLRTALAKSKNSVAWQLFEEVTPKVGLSYLKAMNFSKLAVEDERLTSSLGGLTNGASPVEMAAAYATLENDGDYRMPTCIVKITDAQGNVVVSTTQEAEKIYKTTAARMVTNMMQTVIQEGTGRGLGVSNMPSAGKTGTTNDNKDGWFAGYTPYYTASIWVGFDMPEKLPGLTGSSYPGEIWHTFMENRHQGLAPVEFLPYVQADTYEKELDLQRETQEQGEDSPESPDNGDGDVLQENSSPGDGGLQDG
jgi:membrane peptidoglycan carboxypeptidase